MAQQTLSVERPFVIPRRQWGWQRVRYLQVIVVLTIALFFGRYYGWLYAFFPMRWQVTFAAIFLFFAGLFFVKRRHIYLITLMIFAVVWRQGTFYSEEIGNDLLLFSDFPTLMLLLLLPVNREKRIKFRIPIYIGVVLTLWYLTGRLVAVYPGRVMATFLEQVRALLFMFLIAKFIQNERDLRSVLGVIMALLFTQGFLAMYNWKFGGSALFGGFFTGGTGLRTSGAFGHPNALGMFLTLTLPLAFRYCAFIAQPKWAWFFGLAMLSGLFALYSSFSRTAWIATAGVGVLMVLWDFIHRWHWYGRYRLVLVLGALGVAAIFIKYPGLVTQRLSHVSSEFDASNKFSRMWYIQEAIPIIAANPVFGVGAGNYGQHTEESTNVHSTYLYIAATTGIPGFLLFIGFLAMLYYTLYLAWWYGNFYVREVAVGLTLGLIGFSVAALVAPSYCFHGAIRQCVWILAGVALGLLNIVPIPLSERRRRRPMPATNIDARYPEGVPQQPIPFDMRRRYPAPTNSRAETTVG